MLGLAARRVAATAAVAARPRAGLQAAPRCFAAASPLEATSKLYEELVAKSVKEYQANQKVVADDLDAEISSNKMVLFMEGTPDAPKSEPSLNAVKMLTQAQVVPFTSVDMLSHPAVLGYAMTKSQGRRGPHLFVNGSLFADYEALLQKYNTGELKTLGTTSTLSSGTF